MIVNTIYNKINEWKNEQLYKMNVKIKDQIIQQMLFTIK